MGLFYLELLGAKMGLGTGLDLVEEAAREPERLPRLLACRLITPDDVARPAEASARAMRFSS